MAIQAVLWEDIYGEDEGIITTEEFYRGEGAETGAGFDWGGLLKGFGESAKVGLEAWGKWATLDAQRDAAKIRNELARFRIQQGMTGKTVTGFGGINWLTILAFGGVAIFGIFLLSKTF